MLPKHVHLEFDSANPRKSVIYNHSNGEPVPGILAIDFKATADSSRLLVTLAGPLMTVEGVDAEYLMTDDDLHAIAKRAGYKLIKITSL